MCGICGFTAKDDGKLGAMIATLRHRGPDGNGTFVDDRVSLGHTRLSIIDLSDAGRQPMATPDGGVVITFNGEIYNFLELRAELESKGRTFRSRTDTEVLLAAYLEWGTGMFARLNGMWALCIYDVRAGRLVLCRDRIGVKPLHYAIRDGRLIFASEIKAILCHGIDRTINPDAVDLLLSTQFIPSPMTIFRGIRKLEPRHFLTFDLATCRLEKTCYYEIPRSAPVQDRAKLLEEARALLHDAVRLRLVADVPVGAFLSGGIDSTTVVALMRQRVKGDKLHTVSMGFDIPGLDETEYIEVARRQFGTNHHHVTFRENDGEAIEAGLFQIYDEPVADPSSFPMYALSEETRKWMTVALSGDGADEAFGGYEGRQVAAQFSTLRRFPRVLRRLAHAVLVRVHGYRLTPAGKLAEALRVSLLDPAAYPAEIGATFVYRPDAFKAWARGRMEELLPLSGGDLTEAMLKFDIYFNRLGDNYAAKVDRMSMAHSIEVRSPFLDYRLMELAARIPVRWKLTMRKTKVLMKDLVSGLIPERIIAREKHGFAGPLGAWIDRNDAALRKAFAMLCEEGVLGPRWAAFYREKVFQEQHPIYREYRKRLYFLWKWYEVWGRPAVPAAAPAASPP